MNVLKQVLSCKLFNWYMPYITEPSRSLTKAVRGLVWFGVYLTHEQKILFFCQLSAPPPSF